MYLSSEALRPKPTENYYFWENYLPAVTTFVVNKLAFTLSGGSISICLSACVS
jgi:hypothetical protein